jgi:hypothetical protein
MVIKNAKYQYAHGTKINGVINVNIDGQDMSVPLDPTNRHYQAIQEWVKEGNKIEDAD